MTTRTTFLLEDLLHFAINTNYLVSIFIKEITFYGGKLRSKINQDATRSPQQAHIVEKLCPMSAHQFRDSFAFNHDIAFAQEINTIDSCHLLSVIVRMERQFPLKWDATLFQLQLNPLLVTILIESCSQFFMDFIQCPNHIKYMFFIPFNVYHKKVVLVVQVVVIIN